jgi:hypothetical protein
MSEHEVRPLGAEAVGGELASVRGAVVDDPEHAPGARVGLGGHDLLDQAPEGRDPGLGLATSAQLAAVDVPGGQVAQRTAAVVVVFDALRPARRRRGRRASRRRAWIWVFSSAQITKSAGCSGSPSHRRS